MMTALPHHPRPLARVVGDVGRPRPTGEVCVLFDPGRAVVWLHGAIDQTIADDLADAAADLVDAGLPVSIQARWVTSCDATALRLVTRLVAAGLPVQVSDPDGQLARALTPR
jgi:hypothetical protein